MNVLSLFDGISCGRLALQRAGVQVDCYIASEVDKPAMQVALKNFPDTIEIGDVQTIDTSTLPHIDLLIGGSPCQSFTFAGKRQGMSTTDNVEVTTFDEYMRLKNEGMTFAGQSYLFWEYVRIMRDVKPRYFLLENVKMESRWRDVISDTLGVEPVLLNSNRVSAQNRQRLYWTNIPSVTLPPDRGIVLKDILEPSVTWCDLDKKHHEAFLRSYPKWKPCPIEGKSLPLLASYPKHPPHCPYIPCETSESGFRVLTPIECERLQTLPDNYTEGVAKTQRMKSVGNGWTVDVVAHIFSGLAELPVVVRK